MAAACVSALEEAIRFIRCLHKGQSAELLLTCVRAVSGLGCGCVCVSVQDSRAMRLSGAHRALPEPTRTPDADEEEQSEHTSLLDGRG